MAAEIHRGRDRAHVRGNASMRPRRMAAEISRMALERGQGEHVASMRPRRMAAEIEGVQAVDEAPGVLQ